MGYDHFYYWKKAYALFPGIFRPVAADVLKPHYETRRARRGAARAFLDAVAGCLFQLWVPWRARAVQKRLGLDAAWRRRATAIARARFADPNDIALFRIEKPEDLSTYIRRYENAALNKRINPAGWKAGCALTDKRLFAERCARAGLPHPETLALIEDGVIRILADPAGRSLVAKPAKGEGGGGIQMLGPVRDGDALRELLQRLSGQGTTVVQPLLETHAEIADLALSALTTARIVTMLDEHGEPEVVSATFRCPSNPDTQVDNMKAGGLIAPVDLESGRLGPACKGYGGDDYTAHPATGAAVEGRAVPLWEEAKALAIRAHSAAFREYVMVGWDVALTRAPLMLLEGNGKPGILMSQRAARAGLAQGRYGALLAHHLKRNCR